MMIISRVMAEWGRKGGKIGGKAPKGTEVMRARANKRWAAYRAAKAKAAKAKAK